MFGVGVWQVSGFGCGSLHRRWRLFVSWKVFVAFGVEVWLAWVFVFGNLLVVV